MKTAENFYPSYIVVQIPIYQREIVKEQCLYLSSITSTKKERKPRINSFITYNRFFSNSNLKIKYATTLQVKTKSFLLSLQIEWLTTPSIQTHLGHTQTRYTVPAPSFSLLFLPSLTSFSVSSASTSSFVFSAVGLPSIISSHGSGNIPPQLTTSRSLFSSPYLSTALLHQTTLSAPCVSPNSRKMTSSVYYLSAATPSMLNASTSGFVLIASVRSAAPPSYSPKPTSLRFSDHPQKTKEPMPTSYVRSIR